MHEYERQERRTRKINGQHFTPTAAELIDSIAVLRGRAAHEAVEARQEQLLEFGEELVDVVFRLERLDEVLIHMLDTHNQH